jgi:uncharacterized membrane protein
MKQVVAVGLTVLAGAALLEVALVPGILIGGAAVLAPRLLGKPRRRRQSASPAAGRERNGPAALSRALQLPPLSELLPKLGIGQAIAKTITFRIIVTVLDFSTNYVVIGELATAAGLSSFNLVAGPLFYLGHEAVWNYLGDADGLGEFEPGEAPAQIALGGWTVSRALAKTVTFRSIASSVDFTVNYLVVGDLATALLLSASGLVLGPFVYYGHEKAWEYFTARREAPHDLPAATKLLPAPAL